MGVRTFIAGLLASLTVISALAQSGVVIAEFMASNSRTLADADGDFSDWIELQNVSPQTIHLAGWRLTDDPKHQSFWTLPATNLPAGNFLLVFASGKDRAVAGRELHASFRLSAAGEYLALLGPDGSVATAFSPKYPAQLPDVAFGSGRAVVTQRMLPLGSPARVLVPADGSLGLRWTGSAADEPFNDSAAGWLAGTTGVGFDAATGPDPLGPMGYWDFNSAANASRADDVSGGAHHGTVIGATFTADRGGHSGGAGDRALNFGNGNGRVRVPDAANGVFDSASRSNALTVSLWIFGGAGQPAQTTAFWITENADGSGARAAQAHLPWSDNVIYWDTGNGGDCCSPAGRISKAEPDSTKWKGRWNHYVFLKRGEEKEIWQNGSLFHLGNGAYPLATLRNVSIGALRDGSGGYIGLMDDFALWNRALSPDEIQALANGASPLALGSFSSVLGTDLGQAMRGVSSSAFIRIPFQVAALPDFDSLQLRLQYDAGFIAYLNGIEVARRNAASTAWNATAASPRPRGAGLRFEEIDLPGAAGLLRPGANVLAIHGLNESAADPSFLIRPELLGLRLTPNRFLPEPTPGAANGDGVIGFVAEPEFSVAHGFFTNEFTLVIRAATAGATLGYTTNGSPPSATNGFIVTPANANLTAEATVTVRGTTVVRAAAFRDGFKASPSVSQTYVFPAAVARQPVRPAGMPTTWPDGSRADFEVDPDVVNRTLPGYGFGEALAALPCLSIVADPKDLWDRSTGIYANSIPRGDAWERAASAELFSADGQPGFRVNCGVHIHGNISRQNDFTPKHSFRLVFKAAYGPTDLEFPLFGAGGAQKFDEVVLKGLSTDSWPCVEWGPNGEGFVRWFRKDASYIRDQWVRDAYDDMGQLGCRGRFVHLFLNGLYWGIYNLTEHPSASFQAENYGGARSEYDAFKDFTELDSGTMDAWNAMMSAAGAALTGEASYQRLEGNNPDGTRNPALPWHLNVDNLIDYMVLHIAIGADDWPNHNWWGARRRGAGSEGFRFFPWDQEISINSLQRTQTSWGGRYEDVDVGGTPTYLYARLRANANFRLRFADHVHRHFFNGGALSPAANDARWQKRVTELDQAIVAESARWGDFQRGTPYRRETEWLANNRWMHDQFWPKNHDIALGRFRRAGLYPTVTAPTFSQHGGVIAAGAQISVTAPTGTVYCTLDGTDPRWPNGTVSPSALSDSVVRTNVVLTLPDSRRLKARVLSGTTWSALNEAVFVLPVPLAVTELMFNPPAQTAAELARAGGQVFAPDSFEFVELQNLSGNRTLNLAGFRFTNGIRFTFGDTSLAPFERIVVVRSRVAFESRYGSGIRIAGEFGHATDPLLDSQLDNGGERVELADALGNAVLGFTYSDVWFPPADGLGFALELLDSNGDTNLGTSWRVGSVPGGTPGGATTVPVVIRSVARVAEGVRLVFDSEPGQLVSVELATSLSGTVWQSVHVEPMHPTAQTITLTLPVGEAETGFFRLVAP